jgi:hypothetical protein
MAVPVVLDDVAANGECGPMGHTGAAEHPLVIEPGCQQQGLGFLPEDAFLGWRYGTSQGFGGPGNAASSNTEEMPSEMVCWSRVTPNRDPARAIFERLFDVLF